MKLFSLLTLTLASLIAINAQARSKKAPYGIIGQQENLCGVFEVMPTGDGGTLLQFGVQVPAAPDGKFYLEVPNMWSNPMDSGKFYCLDATVEEARVTFDNGDVVDEVQYVLKNITGIRDAKGRSIKE
jgi:hypothetical protein